MKVLLVGNYTLDRQKSMQRFARMLFAGLSAQGVRVELDIPPVCLGCFGGRIGAKWLGYIDKMLLYRVRLQCWSRDFDLVHICDHSNAFLASALNKTPFLATCHDLLAVRSALGEFAAHGEFAQHKTRWSGRQLQRMILSGLRQVPVIVCDSLATKCDVSRLVGKEDQDLPVILLGVEEKFKPRDLEQTMPQRKRFIHVGSESWYKNRLGVLRIFAELAAVEPESELRLIGAPLGEEARQFIAAFGLGPRVVQRGSVSEEELIAEYQNATALIFPSLYEGFGWPILEAQACGCPVFTTNHAPMNVVGGDAAQYFDPQQPQAAAEVIVNCLSREKLLEMRDKGLQNARSYTVERMARNYIEVYLRVLQNLTQC